MHGGLVLVATALPSLLRHVLAACLCVNDVSHMRCLHTVAPLHSMLWRCCRMCSCTLWRCSISWHAVACASCMLACWWWSGEPHAESLCSVTWMPAATGPDLLVLAVTVTWSAACAAQLVAYWHRRVPLKRLRASMQSTSGTGCFGAAGPCVAW